MKRWLCMALLLVAWPLFAQETALEVRSWENIFVHFHEDDLDSAERVLSVTRGAAEEFAPILPLGEAPVHLRLVTSEEEFARLAGSLGRSNVSGVAQSDRGLIILKSPRLRSVTDDFNGTVRHELVHILLFRNADTRKLPRWLNEGTAMMLANEYRWQSMLHVARMVLSNSLEPIGQLDRAFGAPGHEIAFGNAYAQGLSMTQHLRDTIGEASFWEVVRGTREMSFPESLEHHGGLSYDEFWKSYKNSLWMITLVGTLVSGSLFGPAAVLLVIGYVRLRRKNRRKIREWEAEEREEASNSYVWPPY